MNDLRRRLESLFCSFFTPVPAVVRARRRPDPAGDDDDWEALDPTADDLEDDPEADVDWWREDDEPDDEPDDVDWSAEEDENE